MHSVAHPYLWKIETADLRVGVTPLQKASHVLDAEWVQMLLPSSQATAEGLNCYNGVHCLGSQSGSRDTKSML